MSGNPFPDINAGAWYLRARLDGSWDVCEPTTGEPVAEVTAESLEQEKLETWIMAKISAGEALPGLYPPNAENKARYEAEKGP